ncbi:hypothetical protein GCM10007301_47880 [Azorhizobium oxalatiphilum]|uniref:Uncharacterized protein n=1 Tax=Azorhizobium oxalatiphilum TaxID=980631 RepID=A0A917CBA5_9HYPH|nr:hypothetical protein [Azorhizobium oxalatiphilum]GGF82210.1 hypothetical protein GCM10007301_47880 [Azorhizobium oxalatiphilum]
MASDLPPGFSLDPVQSAGPPVSYPALTGGSGTADLPPGFTLDEPEGNGIDTMSGFNAAFQGLPDAPTPPKTGTWNNATAGLNEAIYTVAGAPVDLARGAINLGIRGVNAATGSEVPPLYPGVGGSEWFARQFERVGVNNPADVQPANSGERVARAAGQGVGYAIAPEAALAGLTRAGAVAPAAGEVLGKVLGRSATAGDVAANAIVGGVSGAGAGTAGEVLPEEYRPLAETVGGLLGGVAGAGAVALPGAAREAGRVVGEFSAPLTASGRQQMAANTLRSAATDLPLAREALENAPVELVGGSRPTTFQMTGDMGLGGLERVAATRAPEAFNARRAEQNSARVGALEGIQPGGHAEAVVGTLRQTLADIDAATGAAESLALRRARSATHDLGATGTPEGYGADMAAMAQPRVDQARAAAQGSVDALGGRGTPEGYGAQAREALSSARQEAKVREDALWDAVDPGGTLNLPAGGTREAVIAILKDRSPAGAPFSAVEKQMFQTALRFREVIPFKDIREFRTWLNNAMSKELSENGRTQAYGRMSRVRGAVENDIEGAVAARAEQEAQAIASGAMREEDSLLSLLTRWRDGWQQQQASWGATGTAVGPDGTGGAGGFSGARRGASQGRGQFSDAAGDQGVSGRDIPAQPVEANFDDGAAGRLSTASAATRQRAQTFDEGSVGQALQPGSRQDTYRLRDANVPSQFFTGGADSFQRIQEFRKAAGDGAALVTLRDYAVSSLRQAATRPDGTLDPNRYASWMRQHANGLRAFPELVKEMGTAAKASRALDEAALFPQGTLNSEVGGQVFKAGPTGYEAATRFINGVGDQRAQALVQDYALSTLRKAAELPDGTLDPSKVAQWRAKHSDALRALPEVDRLLAEPVRAAEVMAQAAIDRKVALDQFQQGAVGKLLGIDDPADVTRTIGSLFGRQDAAKQMAQLANQVRANPEAKEGLRKAVVDYINGRFVSNTEAGTSQQGLLKADQFQTFVRQNRPALRHVMSQEEINLLSAIAADLQRANRSITAVELPGQSNTAQDLAGMAKQSQQPMSWLGQFVLHASTMAPGAAAGTALFGPAGTVLGAIGGGAAAKTIGTFRARGLAQVDDIVKEAMLNPELAKTLLAQAPRKPTQREMITFQQRVMRALGGTQAIEEDR